MTAQVLIDAFRLPAQALVAQRIPKKLLVEQGAPTAADKRLINDTIDELWWQLAHVSLVAAGGRGFNPRHIGYRVWPKLGFDADLLPGELDDPPGPVGCQTVQDVLDVDAAWWEQNGSQRRMTFDLAADSRSWRKLLPYVLSKVSVEDPHV